MRNPTLKALAALTLVAAAVCGVAPAADAFNALPEGDFENRAGELPEFWHRMDSYTRAAAGAWKIAPGAAHGGKAAAVGVAGPEYLMVAEVRPAGDWVAEAWVRADRPDAKLRLRLGWYANWSLDGKTQVVEVGREWRRVRIEAKLYGGKMGHGASVAELGFQVQGKGRVWIDDVRLHPKKGSANPARKRWRQALPPLKPQPAPPGRKGRVGQAELRFLDWSAFPRAVPVRLGAPLPRGDLYDVRRLRVVTADGVSLPTQARPLLRWVADGSVKSVLLTFALPPGTMKPPVVKYDPANALDGPTSLAEAPDRKTDEPPSAAPRVRVALGGGEARSALTDARVTASGKLARTSRAEWRLTRQGEHVGTCKLWSTDHPRLQWRQSEFVYVNDVRPFVSLRESISLDIASEAVRGAERCLVGMADGTVTEAPLPVNVIQIAEGAKFRAAVFSRGAPVFKPGRAAGWVIVERKGSATAFVVEDFWWKHPRALRVTRKGVGVDLWPAEVRDLKLSRGIAMSVRFQVIAGRSAEELLPICRALTRDPAPRVTLTPAAYCRSEVFGVEMTAEESPFTMFEQTVAKLDPLRRHSRSGKLRQAFHGVFNYGDASGDGGWGNAETMLDHAFVQWFVRTGGRSYLDAAEALARHFRDVDVEHPRGEIHCHCMNHTISGAVPSHSWIQGMCDHYALTGNPWTLETLRQCGRWLCELDPKSKTGRSMTRLFDNLVDLYLFTGDAALRDRALEYARVIRERQDPSRVLSGGAARSWFEHRYTAGTAFVWYGTHALAKLHRACPTDELRKTFLTEMDISINCKDRMPFLFKRYPQYRSRYSGDFGPAFQAREIGNWARGRGAVVWPSLAYAFELTGDKRYLDVGLRAFAYYTMRILPDTVFFATPLLKKLKEQGYGADDEQRVLREMARQQAGLYPKKIKDPDFETEGLDGWQTRNRKGRIQMARDPNVRLTGKSSLRMQSLTKLHKYYARTRFYLKTPGRYRVRVWFKAEKGVRPGFAVNYRRFYPPLGATFYAGPRRPHPEHPAWRALVAMVEAPGPGSLDLLVYNLQSVGSVWYDHLEIERVGDCPPKPPASLRDPGFESKRIEGWRLAAPWMGHYSADGRRAIQGRRSLRIVGRNRRNGYVHQTLAVRPRTTYIVAVWTRTQAGGEPDLVVRSGDAEARGAPTGETSKDWRRLAATLRTDAKGSLRIQLHNAAGAGEVWYDDVRVWGKKPK